MESFTVKFASSKITVIDSNVTDIEQFPCLILQNIALCRSKIKALRQTQPMGIHHKHPRCYL